MTAWANRIAAMTPFLLQVLAPLALILGVVRVIHMLRARTMRTLASKWGFQYIGPPAPKWWNPSHPKTSTPFPAWFSVEFASIRQVWNVIEGQQDGVSVLIFDVVVGFYGRGGAPCTFIACHSEPSPFGTVTSRGCVIQLHGWTVLHSKFLWLPWPMSAKRLDSYLDKIAD
jgi:hypothetical protein